MCHSFFSLQKLISRNSKVIIALFCLHNSLFAQIGNTFTVNASVQCFNDYNFDGFQSGGEPSLVGKQISYNIIVNGQTSNISSTTNSSGLSILSKEITISGSGPVSVQIRIDLITVGSSEFRTNGDGTIYSQIYNVLSGSIVSYSGPISGVSSYKRTWKSLSNNNAMDNANWDYGVPINNENIEAIIPSGTAQAVFLGNVSIKKWSVQSGGNLKFKSANIYGNNSIENRGMLEIEQSNIDCSGGLQNYSSLTIKSDNSISTDIINIGSGNIFISNALSTSINNEILNYGFIDINQSHIDGFGVIRNFGSLSIDNSFVPLNLENNGNLILNNTVDVLRISNGANKTILLNSGGKAQIINYLENYGTITLGSSTSLKVFGFAKLYGTINKGPLATVVIKSDTLFLGGTQTFSNLTVSSKNQTFAPLTKLIIEDTLDLQEDLKFNQDNVLVIENTASDAITGKGMIPHGTIQRKIVSGIPYRFESDSTRLKFETSNALDFTCAVTTLTDTIDTKTTWIPVKGKIDTINNIVSIDSINGFSRWTVGKPKNNKVEPSVKRIYGVKVQTADQFLANFTFRYLNSEVIDHNEDSLIILRNKPFLLKTKDIDFGEKKIGDSSETSFFIYSDESDSITLNLSSIVLAGDSSQSTFVFFPQTVRLAPMDSSKITIRFIPKSIGLFTSKLIIENQTIYDTIFLSGLSSFPALNTNMSSLSFGSVKISDSISKTITLTNSSPNPLIIYSITNKVSSFSTLISKDTIQFGDTITLTVQFKPNQINVYKDTLFILNNSNVPVVKLPLEGIGSLTSVILSNDLIPQEYSLSQNYPNPFNPNTTIRYGLPSASIVSLKIFNILGQQVSQLVNSVEPVGWHEVVWNANISSGLYFYRLDAISTVDPQKRFTQLKKMVLLK